jgi:nucleoside-diphosphate kinase
MAGRITFTIIKPGAVQNEHIGPILSKITDAGFHIAGMKMVQLSRNEARRFYCIHEKKPFFEELIEFMVSGPIVVAILEKHNAVEDFRKLIGNTDPQKAEPGTIRNMFAKSVQANAVHGSDSDENARKESEYFFSGFEKFFVDEKNCVQGAMN